MSAMTLRIAAAAGLLATTLAQAEPATYLQFSGIRSASPVEVYRAWTEVAGGVNFEITRAVVPRGGGFDLGKPVISEVGWTQQVDPTMPPLLGHMVQGKPIRETRFQLVADGPGGLATVAQVRLADAYVTGLNLQGSTFSGALSVVGFGLSYKPFMHDGSLGGPSYVGYDFSKAESRIDLATPFEGYRYRAQPFGPGGPAGDNSIFVRHNQASEAGASRVQGYEGWSEVLGMSWNASASFNLGGGSGGAVGKARAGELVWQQALDTASFMGLADLLGGKENDELVMEFVRRTDAGPVTFMQLVFRDFQASLWGLADQTVEQALSFSSVVQTVWAIRPDGTRGAATTIGWDVTKNSLIDGAMPVGPAAGFGAGGLNGAVAAIPEPQTALMLAAGLFVIARRRLRG